MSTVERDVRTLDRTAYERAYTLIEELPSTRASGLDLGTFGTVGHPGISDLDIIAVGEGPALQSFQRELNALLDRDPQVRCCLWYPPLFVLADQVRLAARLHRLRGPEPGSEVLRLLHGVEPPDDDAVSIVTRWAWFLLLLPIASRLLERRNPSLRTMLLVHKNLVESTASIAGGGEWTVVDSVRDDATRVGNFDPIPALSEALLAARGAWNAGMADVFGALPLIFRLRVGKSSFRADAEYRIRRREGRTGGAVLRPADIASLGYVSRVSTGATTGSAAFAEYRSFHVRVARALKQHGLHNGFVTPFGIDLALVEGVKRHAFSPWSVIR